MHAKQLLAGGMAALMLISGVFGVPVQASAHTLRQEAEKTGKKTIQADTITRYGKDRPGLSATGYHKDSGLPVTEYGKDKAELPVTDMRAEFYQTDSIDGLAYRTNGISLKNIQVDDSYNLSESIWAGSGNDYYFSQLGTTEKKLYLNLKKQADRYLTSTEPFQTTEVVRDSEAVPVYILPLLSYEGLSIDQMKRVFYCFLYENPQYYFMRNSVIYSENTNMMTVGLYGIFADGNVRAGYTSQFAGQLQAWDGQVNAAGTVVEKEQLIHKLVCDHVTYDESMEVDDPDDKQMSQSCISAVLFGQKTVCAGYAQMFTLLCARAGIECVTVTSASHAWNKVRMGSVWYNVDCTWDDCRSDNTFLNITDGELLAADTPLAEHVLSAEWAGLAPSCTQGFDADTANAPDLAADVPVPEKMPDTLLLGSPEKGMLSVSFGPMEGCDGYTVQYASNGAMLPADKIDTEETSCTLDGLKSGKAYYIRVRAYRWDCNGEKLYGTYSKKGKAAIL